MVRNSKFAIVIASFDGYGDLWEPFFDIFFKMWEESKKYRIYLINNTLKPVINNVTIINTGKEVSWSRKMKNGLDQIEEDNILLFLDDYFIANNVDSKIMKKTINYFISNQLDYLRIVTIPQIRTKDEYIKLSSNIRYAINLQPSIWNRRKLIENIEMSDFSAWEFEKKYNDNEFIINNDKYFATSKNLIEIKNGVIKGKWYPDTLDYFLKKNYRLNEHSLRQIMTKKEVNSYKRNVKIMKITPKWIIKILKPLLKKIGFKFTT